MTKKHSEEEKETRIPDRYRHLKLLIPSKDEALAATTYSEIDRYSITPTIFKSRDFSVGDYIAIKTSEMVQPLLAVVKAKLGQIQQISGALNAFKAQCQDATTISTSAETLGKLQPVEIALTAGIEETVSGLEYFSNCLMLFNDFIKNNTKAHLVYVDIYSNNDNGRDIAPVVRFGINARSLDNSQTKDLAKMLDPNLKKGSSVKSSGSKKSNKDDQNILLNPLEVLLLQQAISELLQKKLPAVLVDIFAKDPISGNINLEKDGKLETHTITLYKNNDREFVVIDPSNSNFSKHLASSVNQLFIFGSNSNNILVSSKELQIYVPNKEAGIGAGSTQYRDCIDIAIKIALGLNKLKGQRVDPKKLDTLDAIQKVTNQLDIDENLPEFISDRLKVSHPMRIKQASNDGVREAFNKLLKVTINFFSGVREINTLPDNSEEIYKLFLEPRPYTEYSILIKQIFAAYDHEVQRLHQITMEQNTTLLAEINLIEE